MTERTKATFRLKTELLYEMKIVALKEGKTVQKLVDEMIENGLKIKKDPKYKIQ